MDFTLITMEGFFATDLAIYTEYVFGLIQSLFGLPLHALEGWLMVDTLFVLTVYCIS